MLKITTPHSKEEIKARKGKVIQITLHKESIIKLKSGLTTFNEIDKHQNNIKEILLNSNATPIRRHTGIGYACCFCSEQYPEPADLKLHTIENHNDDDKSNFMKGKDLGSYFVKLDITDLKCNLCSQGLDNVEKLMNHLQITHDKKLYTDIQDHVLPFKFSKDVLSCCICMNLFNTFKALQEHMNIHYRNFICEVCGAGFVNKNILRRHDDAHRTGDFKCEECSKTFDTARKKSLHDRSHHSGQKLPHKCGYCSERFKEVLQKHVHLSKVHGVKTPKFICQVCDKVFDNKKAWRDHTARVHLVQKRFDCAYCDMKFYAKKELDDHVVKHTRTREFMCDICLKTYGRQKTLKEHVRRVHQ